MLVCGEMKICHAANPLRFTFVMPCSQQHPTGFIVLREVMRNGGIYRIPVQWILTSVNHRAVHCIRLAVKIFMNFTRIDFRMKIEPPVYGYGKTASVRFCTPVLRASYVALQRQFYTLP